jgi:hypothetical protein
MCPLFVTHRAFFHALRCLARGGTQRAADIIFGYFSGAPARVARMRLLRDCPVSNFALDSRPHG